MVYAAAHHKVTIYGDAYNGAEHWSFGFRCYAPSPGNEAAQQRASEIGPAVLAFWNETGTSGFWNTHRLQGVKVAQIDPDGNYPEDHIPGEVFFANVPGPNLQNSAAQTIPQAAICVTLVTARPRGLASKGRFFLPPTQTNVGTDGLLVASQRDTLLTRVKNFLTAVNNSQLGTTGDIAIFSNGRGVKSYNATTGKIEWSYPNVGPVERVTSVEIGRVVDTQRRRRRSLTELRTGQALG